VSAREAAAAVVAWAMLAWAAPAVAADVWKSADGQSAVELHGFYKTFDYGLAFPDGLVDGSEALAGIAAQARAQLPPGQVATVPAYAGLPDRAGLSSNIARVWGRALWTERLELDFGWEGVATIASDPALAGGVGLGTVQTGTRSLALRRLVDFNPLVLGEGGLAVTQNLDLLAVKWKLPFGEVVAGRQVLSWGTGRFWNPTDLLSPFAPTDIDKEVRHGVDALRLTLKPSSTSLVDLLWLPQPSAANNGGVARFQANLRGYDLSVSAAKYATDLVAGADLAGDLGPLAVHAEAAYTWGLLGLGTSSPVTVGAQYLRAVAGADWRPTSSLFLSAEYYFNGFGATQPSGYLAKMTSFRETSGQVFGAGRHYLGAAAAWKVTDLLSLSFSAIANLQDPSVILVPMVEYWFEQSVILRVGAYGPIGAAPDPGALQQLTANDMVTRDSAYTSAISTYGIRSEYGLSAYGLFTEVGIYF
jgi:hypothetical protein